MKRLSLLLAFALLAVAPATAQAKTSHCRTFLPKSSGVWVGKITAHDVKCSYADGLVAVMAVQPTGYPLPRTIQSRRGNWTVRVHHNSSRRFKRPFLYVAIRHGRQLVTFNLHR